MSTKSTTVKLTEDEIRYERRVKSVELAIKFQDRRGSMADSVVKAAEKIYTYLNT